VPELRDITIEIRAPVSVVRMQGVFGDGFSADQSDSGSSR